MMGMGRTLTVAIFIICTGPLPHPYSFSSGYVILNYSRETHFPILAQTQYNCNTTNDPNRFPVFLLLIKLLMKRLCPHKSVIALLILLLPLQEKHSLQPREHMVPLDSQWGLALIDHAVASN